MSDGSDDEAEASSPSFSSTLEQLSRLVRLPRYDKQQAKTLVDRIAKMGIRHGFNDQQATQILQLALRGATHTGRCISSRISSLLIRSIHPASNQQFGEEFVFAIVGALGPADDAVVDSNAEIAAEGAKDDQPSSASESDDEDGDGRRHQKRRVKLAVGVQAAAVRLLVLLLCPPSIASFQLDEKGNEPTDNPHLPASFLTNKARRTLDKCYDILFHFLDYQTLRPYICHVLSLTTRRKHVRHHRIVKLMSLRNTTPEDSHLGALITTCSKYYPDLHLANAASQPDRVNKHAGGIRYPDSKWLLLVHSIWRLTDNEGVEASLANRDGRPHKRRKETRSTLVSHDNTLSSKSLASLLLPAPSVLSVQEGSILLTEIMTYKGLGYAFDRLQMPSHLVCAITHDMLATAICAQESATSNMETNMARISDWAISAIGEEMNFPSSKMIKAQERRPRVALSLRKTASMLLLLGEFVERMGACTASLQRWTSRLLHASIWRSLCLEEKQATLNIVESFVPGDWSDFSKETLEPLQAVLSTSSDHEAALVLDTLRRLLEKWVDGRNWADISIALDNQSGECFFGFRRLSSEIDYIETIEQTISTVVQLSSSLLVRFPHSLEVMDASLGVYETVFTLPFIGLHKYHLPPSYPFYLLSLTQHGSIATLSRLFGVAKQILDLHVELSEEDDSMDESMMSVRGASKIKELRKEFSGDDARDAFNDCSVYLTDLVWRSNAFGTVLSGDIDIGLPREFFDRLSERCDQRADDLVRVGSMTHGATLGPSMEAHANAISLSAHYSIKGPITTHALEQASRGSAKTISYTHLRDSHLDWLADRHAIGLRDLFYSTISRFREAQIQLQSSLRDQSSAVYIA